jgi:hypothetical protein
MPCGIDWARAKAMQAMPPVDLEGAWPEQFRQLPGGHPTQQVHLKKPVLTVQIPGDVDVCCI